MKRVVVAVISALAIAVAGAGVAHSVINVTDFQAALTALSAVDPALAVEAQANSNSERDFAVGGGQSSVGSNFGLSAHSGPSGEDAFGHLSDTVPDGQKIRARIVCLQVVTDPLSGVKTAGMFAQITESESNTFAAGSFIRSSVRDTGQLGGSGDGYRRTFQSVVTNPMVCPPQAVIFDLERGNINIHDAP
jgi:hypothetical protein